MKMCNIYIDSGKYSGEKSGKNNRSIKTHDFAFNFQMWPSTKPDVKVLGLTTTKREAIGKHRRRIEAVEGNTEWVEKRGKLASYRSSYST